MTKRLATTTALHNAYVASREARWIDAAAAYTFAAAECDKQDDNDSQAAAEEYRICAAACLDRWDVTQ